MFLISLVAFCLLGYVHKKFKVTKRHEIKTTTEEVPREHKILQKLTRNFSLFNKKIHWGWFSMPINHPSVSSIAFQLATPYQMLNKNWEGVAGLMSWRSKVRTILWSNEIVPMPIMRLKAKLAGEEATVVSKIIPETCTRQTKHFIGRTQYSTRLLIPDLTRLFAIAIWDFKAASSSLKLWKFQRKKKNRHVVSWSLQLSRLFW